VEYGDKKADLMPLEIEKILQAIVDIVVWRMSRLEGAVSMSQRPHRRMSAAR
jgi:hypothetical protein